MDSILLTVIGFATAALTVYMLRRRQFMRSPLVSIMVSMAVFMLTNVALRAAVAHFAPTGMHLGVVPIWPLGAAVALVGAWVWLGKSLRGKDLLRNGWFKFFAVLVSYLVLNAIVVAAAHQIRPSIQWTDLFGYSIVGAMGAGLLAGLVNAFRTGVENRRLANQGVKFYRGLPLTAESYEGMGGGGMMARWKPRVRSEEKGKITFANVGGCTEAKIEIQEVVEFLKDPTSFNEFGGRPPKGILLTGDPGNGKTLLAKAVAGEAGVPFYEMAGSDFVEKYVGVGPSRIRDTFAKAAKDKAAIIFIDELDALAAARSADGTGNREYENTLNAFLVEMDGMSSSSNVVVLGATNRPDILDPAVVRPGRFDRAIDVDKPDVAGRIEIFKIHMQNKPLADDVAISLLADRTAGYSGAEIMSACNEAAIVAARRYRKAVESAAAANLSPAIIADIPKVISLHDCDEGLDRAKYGPARESRARAMTAQEKANSAWHELGHAALSQHFGQPVEKITILPRGKAGAYVITSLTKGGEASTYDDKQLRARICVILGGRAATEVFLKRTDTGPADDLTQANRLARSMVVDLGMSDDVGLISSCTMGIARGPRQAVTFGPALLDKIDAAVHKIVEECRQEARTLLEQTYRARVEAIFPLLIKKETLLAPQWQEAWQSAAGASSEPVSA
jgi:cell division protease FtsH